MRTNIDDETSSDEDDEDLPQREPKSIFVKRPLIKMIRDPQHVNKYISVLNDINKVVTASYLFAKHIFVNEYEDIEGFNADEFMQRTFLRKY